ncbi:hypothetical protein VMCG_02866 [Cytospora schulzeri]|uniref:Uncharacterized protein n=1 Tax=Cytospora schulzeri TaxID=448051 RepID=A0A423WZB8_9PEZI|nr:hypothetical protein VMCG_02866 [Valsa malicola]
MRAHLTVLQSHKIKKDVLAIKERKKGTRFPLDVHKTSRSYELHSCDYVEHLWSTLRERQYRLAWGGRWQIHLDSATCCDFGLFEPPRLARRKTSTYKADTRHDISSRFVGERHVKVMLPREFVTCDGSRPISDSAPAVFTFYGTMINIKKPGGQG